MNGKMWVWLVSAVLVVGCRGSEGPTIVQFGAGVPQLVPMSAGPVIEDAASTGGVSWADVDGDGDADLFVTNGYDVSAEEAVAQPNRLYLNDGEGGLLPVEGGPLVDAEGFSSGSTWADFDNDGDVDVFVSNQRGQDNMLFRNLGDGNFERILEGPAVNDGGASYSASWVDIDRDGWLDLYVANGGLSAAEADFLYRNRGDGTFDKITEGPVVSAETASGGGVWGDYDDDGDPDLYVPITSFNPAAAADALFINDGDFVFTRVTEGPIVEDGVPASSGAWGDMDNDGDLDLVVGTMYGLANRIYRNDGGGAFTRVESGPAVSDAGHTYGVSWAEVDNDGDLDLLVANWGAAPVLYLNDGHGGFSRARVPAFESGVAYASSLAWADLENDGDLDVVIGFWPNSPGPGEHNQLLTNSGSGGSWLKVRLVGTAANRSGLGARILLRTAAGGMQMREVSGLTSWRSQNDLVQHFGLGESSVVSELEVRWPSGAVSRLTDVASNEVFEVME